MVGGSDFIMDLLAFLDTMRPVVDLMLQVQSLDMPLWKLKLWWSSVDGENLQRISRFTSKVK